MWVQGDAGSTRDHPLLIAVCVVHAAKARETIRKMPKNQKSLKPYGAPFVQVIERELSERELLLVT